MKDEANVVAVVFVYFSVVNACARRGECGPLYTQPVARMRGTVVMLHTCCYTASARAFAQEGDVSAVEQL